MLHSPAHSSRINLTLNTIHLYYLMPLLSWRLSAIMRSMIGTYWILFLENSLLSVSSFTLVFMPLCWYSTRKRLKLLQSAILELWDCPGQFYEQSVSTQAKSRPCRNGTPKALTSLKSRYICIVSMLASTLLVDMMASDDAVTQEHCVVFVSSNSSHYPVA